MGDKILILSEHVSQTTTIDGKSFDEEIAIGNAGITHYEFENYLQTKKLVFKNCLFKKNVTVTTTKRVFEFEKCTFQGELQQPKDKTRISFNECKFKIIKDSINLCGGEITRLEICDTHYNEKFYINKQTEKNDKNLQIDELLIKGVVFNDNFKLHHSHIGKYQFEDVDFEKNADFLETFFNCHENENSKENQSDNVEFKNKFYRINFRKLALFNNVKFCTKADFTYVTFENQAQFFKATFYKGIDLDHTTIMKEMNFFEAKGLESNESKDVTSQETYRIIKHNFKKLNNQIEANRFHVLELEAKNNNLYWSVDTFPFFNGDKIIYSSHQLFSRFGTNWLRPLGGILVVGILTTLFIHGHKIVDIFFTHSVEPGFWRYVGRFFENALQYTYIFKRDFLNAHSLIFVLNKAALGYLYYQFVSAIRKDTKG